MITDQNTSGELTRIKEHIEGTLMYLGFERALAALKVNSDSSTVINKSLSEESFPGSLRQAEDQEELFTQTFSHLCRRPFDEMALDLLISNFSMARRFHEMALIANDALMSGVFPAIENRWIQRFTTECPDSFDSSSLNPQNIIHVLGKQLPQTIVTQGQEQLGGLSEIGLKIRKDELKSVWNDPHLRASYGKALAWFQEPEYDDEAFRILVDAVRHSSHDPIVIFTLLQHYSNRIQEPLDFVSQFVHRLDDRTTILFKSGFPLSGIASALSAAAFISSFPGPYAKLSDYFADGQNPHIASKIMKTVNEIIDYDDYVLESTVVLSAFRESIQVRNLDRAHQWVEGLERLLDHYDEQELKNEGIKTALRITISTMHAHLWLARGNVRRSYPNAMIIENGFDYSSYFSRVKLESYLRSADDSKVGIWREVAEETLEQWFGTPLVWRTLYEHSRTKPRIWSVVFQWLLEAIQRAPNYGALWDILADATKDSPFGQALAEDLDERRAWQQAQLQDALNKKTDAA